MGMRGNPERIAIDQPRVAIPQARESYPGLRPHRVRTHPEGVVSLQPLSGLMISPAVLPRVACRATLG